MASRSFVPWIKRLIARGYEFHMVFLWLPSAEAAVDRVRQRVAAGGHHVPDEVVRRRYRAGLRNFFTLYRRLATTWQLLDNSSADGPRLLASGRRDRVEHMMDTALWAEMVRNYA